MAEFVLIHGGMHGGWCWDRLRPELAALGHRSIAPDWACDDPALSNNEHAELLVEAINRAGFGANSVLVAHSMGGIIAPLIAAKTPLGVLIYLAAIVPVPGKSFADQIAEGPVLGPSYGAQIIDDQGRATFTEEHLRQRFYADVPPDAVEFALARLRPQASQSKLEPASDDSGKALPTHYIMCANDRAVEAQYSRDSARRLGASFHMINSSHSPFLSQPRELARLLDEIVVSTAFETSR